MIAVHTTKTKIIKFRSRGTKVKDYFRITYAGEEIEYVDNFKHLGVQINYFLSDKVHTDYLYHKGLNSIGALASKVDINKINYDSANRLFQSITLQSATYALHTCQPCKAQQHKQTNLRKLEGFFWKRWAGVSKFTSTTKLLTHLHKDDFLDIRHQKHSNRCLLGVYYTGGLHDKICTQNRCFKITATCCCRYCNNRIHDFYHLLEDCEFFESLNLHFLSVLKRVYTTPYTLV